MNDVVKSSDEDCIPATPDPSSARLRQPRVTGKLSQSIKSKYFDFEAGGQEADVSGSESQYDDPPSHPNDNIPQESLIPPVQQTVEDDQQRPVIDNVQPGPPVVHEDKSPRRLGATVEQHDVPGPIVVPGHLSDVVGEEGAVGGWSPTLDRPMGSKERSCEYEKDGYCVFHGRKGVKKFKPSWVTSTGPDGKKSKKYKKKYEYVCEQKKGGMIQSRLSFLKTTPNSDVSVTAGKAGNNNSNFTTCTEGQRGSSYSEPAGKLVDEKKMNDEKSD